MTRFPRSCDPMGWYHLFWRDQLKPGDIKTVKVFAIEYVVFRAEDGSPHLIETNCPVCLAHFALLGQVVNHQICCMRCHTLTKPTKHFFCERGPWILLWHDKTGRAPLFDIPEIPEYSNPNWIHVGRWDWRVKTHQQELVENVVDTLHFQNIHGHESAPIIEFIEFNPFSFYTIHSFQKRVLGKIVHGRADIHFYSTALAIIRTEPFETLLVVSHTPIEGDYLRWTGNILMPKQSIPGLTQLIGKVLIYQLRRDVRPDVPILENKIFHEKPLWSAHDGPIIQVRKWCNRFY